MVKTTRLQREALKRIYLRSIMADKPSPLTYRGFRRTVIPCLCSDCIMVPFASMWLGIEPDGYTHS